MLEPLIELASPATVTLALTQNDEEEEATDTRLRDRTNMKNFTSSWKPEKRHETTD